MTVSKLAKGLAATALAAAALGISPALAKPEKGKIYDDWTIECEGADKDRHCFASQTQVAKDKNNAQVLKIMVGFGGPKGEPTALLFVPLGIAVQSGISMKIGDKPQATMPVLQCRNEGCIGNVILDADAMSEMQKTSTVLVGFTAFGAGQTVTIPVSMKGFGAAFRTLK